MPKKAILFAANPTASGLGGNVLAHHYFIKKRGAVYWEMGGPGKKVYDYDISGGYIYETGRGVIYRVDIEEIKSFNQLTTEDERFIPEWRMYCFRDEYVGPWLKITNIERLKRTHDASDFVLVSKRRNIQRKSVKRYLIVFDPDYKAVEIAEKTERILDNIIWSNINAYYDEAIVKDILHEHLSSKNLEILETEDATEKGRADIVFSKGGILYVLELKKDVATKETLDQLKTYMRDLSKEYSNPGVKGIIICRRTSDNLEKVLTKKKNIEVRRYMFDIDFGLDF